jgi:hypothetical protein
MIETIPDRPDEAAWLRRRERRWLPTVIVLAVIVLVTAGGYVVAALLATPAGPPIGFPGVVSVQPIAGWGPAGTGSVQGHPYVSLSRGNGTLIIMDWGEADDADALAVDLVEDVLQPDLSQLSVSDELQPVTLADGSEGVRFRFVGVDPDSGGSVEGEVTVVVTATGRGVAFIGLAPEGQLAFVDGDLHTMIDHATVD